MVSCNRSSAFCLSPLVRCSAYLSSAPPCSAYSARIKASSAMRSPLADAVLGTSRRTLASGGRFNGGGEFRCPGGPGSVLTVNRYTGPRYLSATKSRQTVTACSQCFLWVLNAREVKIITFTHEITTFTARVRRLTAVVRSRGYHARASASGERR